MNLRQVSDFPCKEPARPSGRSLTPPSRHAGLDSTSALRILTALKALTTPEAGRRPTTVITTIHQPSSQLYHMFDDVILLAKGGVQLYCGKAREAAAWWESKGLYCPEGWNPADCEYESHPQCGTGS